MTFEEYRKLCERRKELTIIRSYTDRNEMMEINKKINRVNKGLYMPHIEVGELVKQISKWCKEHNIETFFEVTEGYLNHLKILMRSTGKMYRLYYDPKTNTMETEFLKQAFLNPPEIEKLLADYPSLKEVFWDLVKKELQKSKLEEISLINKMIEEKEKERENYIDEQKRQKMIDSLSCDIASSEQKLKEIKATLEEF